MVPIRVNLVVIFIFNKKTRKRVQVIFENGHLFLSIFEKWKLFFDRFFLKKLVLPENPVNTKKIIFICY